MSSNTSLERNKQIVRDFFDKMFAKHDVDGALDNFKPDYIQHNPNVPTGREAIRAAFKQSVKDTPGIKTDIKRIIAEGDLVVVHHHFKPDPKVLGLAVIDIFRIEDGKIAEHWDLANPIPENPKNNNSMF